MKVFIKQMQVVIGIIVLMSFSSTFAEGESAQNKEEVNKPGRLFTIPTTDVLPLGSFSLGGGQAFGKLGSDFLGKMGFGIAPYTEIQINTQKVVNDFVKDQEINTAIAPAIKLSIPYLGENNPYIPSFALALRHNFKWLSEDYVFNETDYQYDKSWTSLFILGSETFCFDPNLELTVSLGWKLNSLRLRLLDSDGTKISPHADEYYQKNIGGPFGGLTFKTSDKSWMMLEAEHIPNIPEPEMTGGDLVVNENNIDRVYMLTVGTRYYLKKWFGFDLGVQYRSDKPDIADMSILLGLNVTFSFNKNQVDYINKKKVKPPIKK